MNNNCNECTNKEICLIYDNLKKFSHIAEIQVNKCKNNIKLFNDNFKRESVQPSLYKKDINKITELSRKASLEKSNKEKEAIPKPKPKKELTAIPLETLEKCKTCNSFISEEDATKCSRCGKEICSICATIDGSTKEILCEKCWLEEVE